LCSKSEPRLKPELARVQKSINLLSARTAGSGRQRFGSNGSPDQRRRVASVQKALARRAIAAIVLRRCSTSDQINGVFMYPVRASILRWGVTIPFAIMLCAWFVTPTLAEGNGNKNPNLHLGHSVVSGTSSFVGCGPVGPGIDCKADCSGTACTFFTTTFTGTGKADPGGPFTVTDTSTAFFGPGGSVLTPNGAVNPDGTRAGVCVPTFGSDHVVFPNGTMDTESKGESCCVGTSCGAVGLGPPITAHQSSVCISGTGKFAGIQCSGEETSSSVDGVHIIGRGESVSTK
jgi:hypothetical protein